MNEIYKIEEEIEIEVQEATKAPRIHNTKLYQLHAFFG